MMLISLGKSKGYVEEGQLETSRPFGHAYRFAWIEVGNHRVRVGQEDIIGGS